MQATEVEIIGSGSKRIKVVESALPVERSMVSIACATGKGFIRSVMQDNSLQYTQGIKSRRIERQIPNVINDHPSRSNACRYRRARCPRLSLPNREYTAMLRKKLRISCNQRKKLATMRR